MKYVAVVSQGYSEVGGNLAHLNAFVKIYNKLAIRVNL